MKVLLDSFDLINLIEGPGSTLKAFDSKLRATGAELVIAWTHVREIAAPLERDDGTTVVSAFFNKLEDLPLCFAEETTCLGRELAEAVRAFRAGDKPQVIDPFFDRLDMASPAPGGTKLYLHYPLSEIVLDLWHHKPELFRARADYGDLIRALARASRTSHSRRQSMTDYSASLAHALRGSALREPVTQEEFVSLASWLKEDASRAPGFSLWWYVREEVTRNISDAFRDSDLGDLTLLWILPYTAVASLDRRMRHYVRQVRRRQSDLVAPTLVEDVHGLLLELKPAS